MKVTIVTGKSGSGRTAYLFKKFKKDQDNFVVTTDSSVYFIEKLMSEKGIPGKCVGISSLAKSVYQEMGGISEDLISNEMQIILLTDIMKNNYSKLSTLKVISYNNGIVDDISSFINECLIQNIKPVDLEFIADKLGSLSYNKMKDIAFIYAEYLKVLKEKHFVNNIIFTKKVINILKGNSFRYKNVYIDSLNKYNPLNLALIKQLVTSSEESVIAFSTASAKSYIYQIYKNSMEAYVDFDKYISDLEGCVIERVNLKVEKESETGINIIKNELFNRDTKTKSELDDVVLHEASTIYKEIDFVASKIKDLLTQGYSYDDIIVTSIDMPLYKNVISNAFNKKNINYYYYKNKKANQTVFFDFMNNIFNILNNGLKVEYILKLMNINYFNFSDEEIVLTTNFFLRFGNDLDIAMKNGEIYDVDNYVYVNSVINKIQGFVNQLSDKFNYCHLYSDFTEALYNYWDKLKLQEVFFEQYSQMAGKRPQLANEIAETWNVFINILDDINLLNVGKTCTLKNFIDVFNKFCEKSSVLNSQEYCDEVKVLDLKDAQNRKSKICFVIGCNEGKFPFNIAEGLITEKEIILINELLKKNLITTQEKMDDAYLGIYSTLILPSDKLILTWAANDTEARPMRSASILNNVVKTFEKNFVKEKKYYDNDKEEVFFDLLNNLGEYKQTGICPEEVDSEYWALSSDPNYSERLNNVILNSVHDKNRINSDNVVDSYKEKKFWAVTRIERFNQCAFKHYIEYALLPKYQKLFEETAANKGNFYHNILNNIFSYIIDNNIPIYTLSYEGFKGIAEGIIDKNISSHNENILESNIALSIEKDKMKRKILKTAWNALLQLKESDFEVFKTEFKIGKDIPLTLTLSNGETVNLIGVIDRIDKADINGKNYVRIIDYKSGLASFSNEKVLLGLQLQLPVYMKSIVDDYAPAGVYYSKILDPVKDIDNPSENISKKYQLNGVTVSDMDVLAASDRLLDGAGSSSDIIQAEITTKGEISKRSKVLTEDEFNEFLDNAEKVVIESIDKILSGETTANPLKLSDFDACEYCQYKSICHIN